MYRSDRVYLAEWIVAAVTGLFIFVSSCTWDLQSLTIWSTNVWDSIAEGRFRELYALTAENVHHVHHAHMGSELMSVLPWSIWNLPIWAMQRFFNKPILDSALMLAYSKLFLVLVSTVMLVYTKKITMLLTGDRTKSVWAAFLTASSVYLYLSVCYSGQNDIFMMTASVIAIYYLLQNRRRAFLLWSVLAIAIKPFFIVPLLAVLLPNINTDFGGVSFFAVALVLIYLYCYTRDFKRDAYADSSRLAGRYAVYMIAVTYAAYLMFSPFSFYRLAVLTPFLYIVLVQNSQMRLYNALLDTAMSLALMLRMVLRGSKMLRVDFINRAVVQRFFGYNVQYNEKSRFADADIFLTDKFKLLETMQPLFAGIAVAAAVLLLAFNHPEKKVSLPVSGDKHVRVLVWARMLIIVPFVALSLYLFAKSA